VGENYFEVSERLLASQKGLCSVKFDTKLVVLLMNCIGPSDSSRISYNRRFICKRFIVNTIQKYLEFGNIWIFCC
jgi:hypothetical protein